jgi:16S rRNA (adenine1518-N6/adenine1519-N6)-dimethyltransferase
MTDGRLLDPTAIRRLAAEVGLRPSKQRGQNFVIDANTVRRLVDTSGVGPGDTVLEIGPGLGSLTAGLLAVGAEVTAIEIEPSLAERLPHTMADLGGPAGRLRVLAADALTVTTLPGPAPNHLVANLPYNVAVPALLHALATWPSLSQGLVMVQLEVADRLAAPPGSRTYGIPSAKIAWHAGAVRAGVVPASVFWPKPNVESGLVRLTRHEPPPTTATRSEVFAVVDAAFAQRRKMLRSALAARYDADRVRAALRQAGLDPEARGETLGIDEFARLAGYLAEPPGGVRGDY